MATDSSQPATSLLTEHLQYTPLSLIDDIINSVNNFIYQGVGSLEAGLVSTPPERLGFKPAAGDNGEPDFAAAKQEIEEGLHQLETLLNATVDRNFDKFEIYVLRNILTVPSDVAPWMQLSHYRGLNYARPQDTATAEQVQLLRRKLAASRALSKSLAQQQAQNEAILHQLRAVADSASPDNMAFLTASTGAQTLNVSAERRALTTNAAFTMSQLPALKALLATLRPQMATLTETRADININSAKEENKQERREYIGQRTQMLLQRYRGALPDDVAALHGRPPAGSELQALEKKGCPDQPQLPIPTLLPVVLLPSDPPPLPSSLESPLPHPVNQDYSEVPESPPLTSFLTDRFAASTLQESVYLSRIRYVRITTYVVSSLIIACALGSLGTSAHVLHAYNSTRSTNASLTLSLWPANIDIRPVLATLAPAAIICVLMPSYLLLAAIPSPHSRTRLLSYVCLLTTSLSFILSIISIFFTTVVTYLIDVHSHTNPRPTILSFTCAYYRGPSRFYSATKHLQLPIFGQIVYPSGFGRLCRESEAAWGLMVAVAFLGLLGLLLVGLGFGFEVAIGRERTARTRERDTDDTYWKSG
ncbi:hypothetical protein DV736_g3299, partial [Chaetothyriales sp. CBS 134916]